MHVLNLNGRNRLRQTRDDVTLATVSRQRRCRRIPSLRVGILLRRKLDAETSQRFQKLIEKCFERSA